ncbi:MAG TPA: DoxX family protein [Albitalea sp.]|uniref:DoxX family protein n=1 Tax=Piscinibacter sp. TaxID=1903157 RepID=UPI002ED1DFE7
MDIALNAWRAPSLATLLLRVALGAMWLTHAIVLKLMTFGLGNLAAWMDSQGFSPRLAGPLVVAEIVGGTLILLGLHGRWASLALQPVLIGALVIHAGNGWVFTAPNGGWEYPVFLMAMSAVHFLLGDGPIALRRER